ncbi:hypothetical protein SCARD494_03238 [Seiridium cardinale]
MEEDKRTERRRLQNRESQRRYRNRRTSRTEFTIKPTAVLHDALSVHKGSDSLMGPVEFYRLGQAVHEPGEQTDLHVGSESESLHHGSADVALASDASFQFVPSTQDIYGAWPSPSPNNLEFASANPNEEACRQYLYQFFEDYLEYMVARFQSISGPSYRISGHNDNDSGSGEDEEDSGIDS